MQELNQEMFSQIAGGGAIVSQEQRDLCQDMCELLISRCENPYDKAYNTGPDYYGGGTGGDCINLLEGCEGVKIMCADLYPNPESDL